MDVAEEFLRYDNSGLTGSFIAKKRKINQKTVSNWLKKLEGQTILKSKIQGKNKLYFLNLDNFAMVRDFVLAAEHLKTLQYYKKNPVIKEICEKISVFILGSGIIFGSYAKGINKKGSDLDILVIGKADEKRIKNISNRYNIDINLKIYPGLEKDLLINEVIKDHIIIKGTEDFVRGSLKWMI